MISAVILTKNSSLYLEKVLESCSFFDEVLLYDSGSQDETLAIASSFSNVKVIEGTFDGFGQTRNQAASYTKNHWIFMIDSDEMISSELKNEIQSLSLHPKQVYSVPRKNFYRGKWIRWCGWHPDRVLRLYNKKETGYNDHERVHESVQIKDKETISLQSPLVHYPYRDPSDFLAKMQTYTTLFAEQNKGKKTSSFFKACWKGAYTFFKCYVLQRGIFGGREGFEISFYNANCAFYKYLKLSDINK